MMTGNIKHTLEQVKEKLRKLGFHLISNEYGSNLQKLSAKCIKRGHPRLMVLGDFSRYPNCSTCKKEEANEEKLAILKEEVESFGYKLLDEIFISNHTQLTLKCKEGHDRKATIYKLRKGLSCQQCLWEEQKQEVENKIKEVAEGKGEIFFEETYINAKTSFKVQCINGHQRDTTFESLKKFQCKKCFIENQEREKEEKDREFIDTCEKGHKFANSLKKMKICPYCSGIRLYPEDVKRAIEKEGYKLISKFQNSSAKIDLVCPEGHPWSVNFYTFRKGHRCLKCSDTKLSDKHIESLLTPNYKLVEYLRADKPAKLICPKGHEFSMLIKDFKLGGRCGICYHEGLNTFEDIKKVAIDEGYRFHDVADPKSKEKIWITCDDGHEYKVSWGNFSKGSRCRFCRVSNLEKELMSFLKSTYVEFDHQDRSIVPPHELDFYLPEYKLGIEMNGIYWHSERFRDKNYHLNKFLACQEFGINLIQIFEDEWRDRKEQVLNFIESKLGINRKVFARKCTFKKIAHHNAKPFLEAYHIQGWVQSSHYFGLFYNDELVQVMSFGKHHRQNSNDILLSRLCTKRGLQIVGGASKLLKNGMAEMRINKVSTFADLRWGNGEVYHALGFEVSSKLRPDYSYFKNMQRFSKQSLKKTEAEKLLNKTEHELRLEQGYLRIYDCGKMKYSYKSKSKSLSEWANFLGTPLNKTKNFLDLKGVEYAKI